MQITEYLEDILMWGGDNETISSTLLGMVILSVEEEERAEEGVEEGENSWVRDLLREDNLRVWERFHLRIWKGK